VGVDRGRQRLGTDPMARVVEERPGPSGAVRVVAGRGELQLTLAPGEVLAAVLVEHGAVRLGAHAVEQAGEGRLGVPDHSGFDARAPADVLAAHVDLHDHLVLRVPVDVGEVRADHEQELGGLEGAAGCRVADHPGLPELVRVIALEPVLGLEGEDHRGGQTLGERQQLVARVARALTREDGDRLGRVDPLRGLRQCFGARGQRRFGGGEARLGGAAGHVHRTDVARQREYGDRLLRQRDLRLPWRGHPA